MANIGTTTAFYKVESSLTRANNEVSKSMERLATGKQNANAGDRSSYVAMSDTFRMDFVGTKAGIKGASVAMGYLETGMRVLDSASSLLSRLQELAVLGANNTNTVQDHEAINLEAEALADEFNRLMTTSAYKGKDVFVDNASSEYVSVGGRNAEMTFGIGRLSYTELYDATNTTAVSYTGGPNNNTVFNLTYKPSDAVFSKPIDINSLEAGVTYEIVDVDGGSAQLNTTSTTAINTASTEITNDSEIVDGLIFKATSDSASNQILGGVGNADNFKGRVLFSDANTTFNTLHKGSKYVVQGLGTIDGQTTEIGKIVAASTLTAASEFVVGAEFTMTADLDATASDLNGKNFVGEIKSETGRLTTLIEGVQAKVNTARVQAGSQYAALESAVSYTTDLTAQYELGYNTVNDVNFSMETAHLAKNQILQQAATAMLAQANQGQQSLLQLIQG
jgi:flagellin